MMFSYNEMIINKNVKYHRYERGIFSPPPPKKNGFFVIDPTIKVSIKKKKNIVKNGGGGGGVTPRNPLISLSIAINNKNSPEVFICKTP